MLTMPLSYLAAVVLVLSMMVESSDGERSGLNAAVARGITRHEEDLVRAIEMSPSWRHIFGGSRMNTRGKYRGGDAVRSSGQDHGFQKNHIQKMGSKSGAHDGHVTNHIQGQGHWYNNNPDNALRKGHHGYVHTFKKDIGAGYRHRHGSARVPRAKRQASTKRPTDLRSRAVNFPRGITYTWTRDYGTGKSFDEAAFKSKDKNVIVVLSFDDALKDANLTASATLYDFTGTAGIMAIKTRKRPGPCFVLETSLTYDKVIAELETRNGSSVSTNAVISLDGTGSPVPLPERQVILKKTPSFARQCRGRDIVRTRSRGFSPIPFDGQTKELKVLTMDAEVTITVPVDPDFDFGQTNQWSLNNLKSRGPGKGRDIWKTL